MSSSEWSPEEDDLLRSMARSGLCLGEIVQKLRRSKSSVHSRATRLKITIARDRNASQAWINPIRRPAEIGLNAKR
jgi:hypothetical protein